MIHILLAKKKKKKELHQRVKRSRQSQAASACRQSSRDVPDLLEVPLRFPKMKMKTHPFIIPEIYIYFYP